MSPKITVIGSANIDYIMQMEHLPSPGETTLTRLGPPGSDFAVDSFFDIHHEIDFQGAPGSVLEGFAGTTEGTVRMHAGQPAGPSNITFEQEGGDQPAFEITGQEFIPPGGGHIEVFHPTGQVKEQASEFDSYHLLISVFQPGPDPMELSIDKDVLNDTAVHWDDFHIHIMELGQTIAGQSIFIDASDSSADGIGFDNVMVMDDAVWFDGGPGAAPGEL